MGQLLIPPTPKLGMPLPLVPLLHGTVVKVSSPVRLLLPLPKLRKITPWLPPLLSSWVSKCGLLPPPPPPGPPVLVAAISPSMSTPPPPPLPALAGPPPPPPVPCPWSPPSPPSPTLSLPSSEDHLFGWLPESFMFW